MMQIYISSDNNDFSSNLIQILCSYIKLKERNFAQLIIVDPSKKDIIKYPLPFLIKSPDPFNPDSKAETLQEDTIEICKEITKAGTNYGFLFGANEEEEKKTDEFIKYIQNDLKNDADKVITYLNDKLLLCTFIGDENYLTFKDLYAFTLVMPVLNKMKWEDLEKICNVVRWADHLQNFENIKDALKIIKFWCSILEERFDLAEIKAKAKKDKKNKDIKEVTDPEILAKIAKAREEKERKKKEKQDAKKDAKKDKKDEKKEEPKPEEKKEEVKEEEPKEEKKEEPKAEEKPSEPQPEEGGQGKKKKKKNKK